MTNKNEGCLKNGAELVNDFQRKSCLSTIKALARLIQD
jgi:hypothetical protein